MSFICLSDYDMQRRKERVTVHDKDHAAAFRNHIITRMLHGSLNIMRAVDGLG